MEDTKNCVLIISHSNYLIKSGGLEKFIRDHCKMLKKHGIHYIHVFPIIELNKKTQIIGKEYAGISLDGVFLGIWDEHKLASAVEVLLRKKFYALANCQIHHFHGWNTKILSHELKKLNVPIYFMVHDLESMAPYMNRTGSEKLCKTQVPIAGHNKICVNCANYTECVKEYKLVVHAFNELNPLIKGVYTPSENTKRYFIGAFPKFQQITKVREHLQFKMIHQSRELNQPIRIAYLGSTADHKGYQEWEKLMAAMPVDQYAFYYFGVADIKDNHVTSIRVDARDTKSKGMTEQLKASNIDIAFLWSKWPETYCYTYYEAIEAGCFVVTNMASGNICDEVKKYKNGMVFKDILDCLNFLDDTEGTRNAVKKFADTGERPVDVHTNDELIGEKSDFNYACNANAFAKKHGDNIKISGKSNLLSLIYENMRMN